ncbi:aryl-alcohol dehydrogenase [Kytococcus aerolatus]|uniref:Aryl-alcohol dehydrogenase n=1 Tax=Kytococcus aerolatus TaxID=592308 RepID=A0A212T1D2_9MICO|nr:NAD(P)-dependent alcohol dehydrogenase [Kytococcus aerolatus]SNC59848.1 aryl-alcohol dehydrogenase [Kytococcus aerolatus]
MSTQIRAHVITEPQGTFQLQEGLEIQDPAPGEVLVRYTSTGLCHTDLFARDVMHQPDSAPAIYGHEGTGVVEQVGEGVLEFAPGDRVSASYASCGTCPNCLRGAPFHCLSFNDVNFASTRPDGTHKVSKDGEPVGASFFGQSSFATHGLVNARDLVKVPDWVTPEDAYLLGPLGCGVQTGAGAVLNVLKPAPSDSIVVSGVGAVGISALMAAAASNVGTIIAVDLLDSRLELAKELGATHVINGGSGDAAAQVQEITGGGATHAFDTTGVPPVLQALVEGLAWGGKLGIVGARPEQMLDLMPVMQFGRSVIGIVEGQSVPRVFIPQLLELRRQGLFPLERIVTTYRFDELEKAIEDTESGASLKAVLVH